MKVPDPDLRALVQGEVIVAFVPRNSAGLNDEVDLQSSGPREPEELKPAYRRWAGAGPPAGQWTAVVESLQPARSLASEDGDRRHILTHVPDGDVAILRVYGPQGAVLSDAAFAARCRSVEAATGEPV